MTHRHITHKKMSHVTITYYLTHEETSPLLPRADGVLTEVARVVEMGKSTLADVGLSKNVGNITLL